MISVTTYFSMLEASGPATKENLPLHKNDQNPDVGDKESGINANTISGTTTRSAPSGYATKEKLKFKSLTQTPISPEKENAINASKLSSIPTGSQRGPEPK